jgi:hypothetical protein
MKIVGISMIRNDADIVEPFVRHTLRLLDHLFVIVHSPEGGTGEILKALQAEGLPMTLVFYGEPAFLQGEGLTWLAREAYAAIRPNYIFALDADEFIVPADRGAIESALALLPAGAPAARIHLRTFVPTSEDGADEPNPLRRIRYRRRNEPKIQKVVLTSAFAADSMPCSTTAITACCAWAPWRSSSPCHRCRNSRSRTIRCAPAPRSRTRRSSATWRTSLRAVPRSRNGVS